jgi:8-oxo-dGTP pyrophosphatase MutT (NUDIX family)
VDILHNDGEYKLDPLDPSIGGDLLSILSLKVSVDLLQHMQDLEASAKQKNKILVVSAVIRDPDGRFLFLRRTKDSYIGAGLFEFPGGKQDNDKGILAALLSEVKEEAHLDIINVQKEVAIQEYISNRGEYMECSFEVEVSDISRASIQQSSEHDELQWLAPEELPAIQEELSERTLKSLEQMGIDI